MTFIKHTILKEPYFFRNCIGQFPVSSISSKKKVFLLTLIPPPPRISNLHLIRLQKVLLGGFLFLTVKAQSRIAWACSSSHEEKLT